MLNDEEFCSECGAGVVERTATTATLRLPDNYPFNKECGLCVERAKQNVERFAASVVSTVNEKVFTKLLDAVK